MNSKLFGFVIVFSFFTVWVNGYINCHHNFRSNVPEYQTYCIYAEFIDGTKLQVCDYDAPERYHYPAWPNSKMNECVKSPPGYLKFKRCNFDWCNERCEDIEPTTTTKVTTTTEQATTTSVASSTSIPTTTTTVSSTTVKPTTEISETPSSTTEQTLTTLELTSSTQAMSSTVYTSSLNSHIISTIPQLNKSSSVSSNDVTTSSASTTSTTTATVRTASTTISSVSSSTMKTNGQTATCSKDLELDAQNDNSNQNGGIQRIVSEGTSGQRQIGKKPSYRPNNCDCRCNHKKEQNTFIVVNGAASFNLATLLTIIAYLF